MNPRASKAVDQGHTDFRFVVVLRDRAVGDVAIVLLVSGLGLGLPVTDIDGGYRSFGIQAVGRWRFGDSWQLQAEAGYEQYNSDIAGSPIAQDDYESEVGVTVIYRF